MLIVPRRRAVTGWTPAAITTAMWLDAADAATVTTVSGAVSQWNDKSGNGNNAAQSTTGNRPTLSSAALNGLDVITFNGTSHALTHSYSSGAAPHTVYVVARRLTGGTSDFQVILNAVAPETPFGVNISAKASGSANWGTYINQWENSGVSCLDTWRITGVVSPSATSGNETLTTDGVQVSKAYSQRYAGDDANRRSIGADPAFNTGYLSGNIAEIVVIKSALTTAQQNQMEGYLAHKWGLTSSLPAGHPYKTAPPLL